ncbi:MAG TPA: hypothetical protein VM555_08300 [Tahibacter sp.]|jgi:hypothetical protein|nr:hypothetical protein [Tahibacter sp.]
MRTFDELLAWQAQTARTDRSSAPAIAVCEELAAEARWVEFALLLRAWVALKPQQRTTLVEATPRFVLAATGADPATIERFIQKHSEAADRVRADCLEPDRMPAAADALRERFAARRADD